MKRNNINVKRLVSTTDWKNYEIGGKFQPEVPGEGAIMELNPSGGFTFIINIADIDKTDIENFESTPEFRFIEIEGRVYMMCFIGYDQLLFEVSFDPTIYLEKRSLTEIEKALSHNEITVFLVERIGSRIKGIKTTNFTSLEHKFLITKWKESLEKGRDTEFKEFFNSFAVENLEDLWEKATIL